MTVNIQPSADYVVAQAEEAETKTASGILLTQSAQEKPKTAKVVAVGKDVSGIKVGDRILYKNSYEAIEHVDGNQTFVIVYVKNIVATVKG